MVQPIKMVTLWHLVRQIWDMTTLAIWNF